MCLTTCNHLCNHSTSQNRQTYNKKDIIKNVILWIGTSTLNFSVESSPNYLSTIRYCRFGLKFLLWHHARPCLLVIIVYLNWFKNWTMFRNNGTSPTSNIPVLKVLIWCTFTAVSFIFPVLYRLSMGIIKPSDCNALMCTVQQTLILDDDIHLLQTVFRQETDLRI